MPAHAKTVVQASFGGVQRVSAIRQSLHSGFRRAVPFKTPRATLRFRPRVGDASMPIRKYIAGTAFDPDTIMRMSAALEGVRTILNLRDPDDPMVETVAKKIISLASQGVTDPGEIRRRIVADSE